MGSFALTTSNCKMLKFTHGMVLTQEAAEQDHQIRLHGDYPMVCNGHPL